MDGSARHDSRMARVIRSLAALAALALAGAPPAGAAEEAAQKPGVTATRVTAGAKASQPKPTTGAQPGAAADSGMTLRGGQARTDFRSMTVEGEDRVQVEVERPTLLLELEPDKVPGLESGSASDVLNRVAPDLMSVFLGLSADRPSPFVARPWLRQFATGAVARFRPNVQGVERWKLVVADSKGQTVKTYQGSGDPPKEVVWDGMSESGAAVTPGLTYSYIFEAFDRAGNKRNFVGEGFRVSAYRIDSPGGPVLVFSGQNLLASQKGGRSLGVAPGTGLGTGGGAGLGTGLGTGGRATPPILLEAAGWINQSPRWTQPVRVTVTARSYEQASFLSKQVGASLAELVLGDPTRIQALTEVVPDAPDGGTVRIALAPGPEPVTAPGASLSNPKKSKEKKDGSGKKKK